MILFYLLIISLPLVDHPLFGHQIFGITVEKFLGLGCFLYALCYLPNRKSVPRILATGQARAFVMFAFLAITSYALMAIAFDWHEMVGTIFVELFFFAATSILIDSRQRLESCLLVLIGSIGLTSLYLIREWVGAVPTYGLGYRPGWVAGDPNVFSASAVTVLPIMVAVVLGLQNGRKRTFCVGCLLLTIIATLLAASRGGFIALIVLLVLQMRDVRHRGKFAVVALIILALFLVSPVSPLDRLIHPTYSDTDSSDARLQLWSVSLRIIADHPILGVGLWQFAPNMLKYLPPGVDLGFHVPHNTYLEVTAELGLVGLALFLAMFFFTLLNLSRIRRVAKRYGDVFMYSIATAIGNGLIAFAITAFFLSAMHAKVFWFSIFLSTCLPAFVARVKTAASDSSLEPRTGVRENAPLTATEQQSAAVEGAGEEQRATKIAADDVELKVDQLRFH